MAHVPGYPAQTTLYKLLTLLCVDFTPLARGQQSPFQGQSQELRDALWERLLQILQRYEGALDGSFHQGHLDDPFLVLFGVPVAHEDDPKRAVQAALDLQRTVNSLLHLGSEQGIRMALHTAWVHLEHAEAQGYGSYTVTGDAAALVQQLSRLSLVPGIVMTHETLRHVGDLFETAALDSPLTLPASPQPLPLYLVQGEKADSFRVTRSIGGLESAFIGRSAEVETLQNGFKKILDEPHLEMVTVVGEAGIGKSRLLQEFNQWLEEQPETTRFFKGRAGSQRRNHPYSLIRDLFAYRFGIQESDPPIRARDKFEQGVRRFMGLESSETLHLLGQLLGFNFSDSPYLRGILNDPEQIRERAFQAAALFFRAVTADRPGAVRLMSSRGRQADRPMAILFLEDIHWADDGSLDMLEFLVQACSDVPMLFVSLARPLLWERRPSWGNSSASQIHTRLDLTPLTSTQCNELVQTLLHKVDTLPPELVRLIVERTDGNPFYVEEFIKMLMEEQVIVASPTASQWSIASQSLASSQVPPTLIGILQARLETLPPACQAILEVAAVVGRVFWDQVVLSLCEQSPGLAGQVPALLNALKEREIIVERRVSTFGSNREFVFKHALLQEVSYDRIEPTRRAHYHARIAAWLVDHGRDSLGVWLYEIAEHYERAGNPQEATSWYIRAGRQAQVAYAPEAALKHYQRAATLLDQLDSGKEELFWLESQRLELAEALGDCLRQQGQYQEALESYAAMRRAAETIDDIMAQARSWNRSSLVYDDLGTVHPMLETARQAEQLLRTLMDSSRNTTLQRELAMALYRQGWALYRSGQAEPALALVQQAMPLCQGLGELAQRETALCQRLIGVIYMMLGSHEQADHFMKQSLGSFQALGDLRWVGRMWNGLGENARLQGEYELAVERYQAALAIAMEIRSRDWEITYRSNLAGARVGLGQYEEAEQEVGRFLEVAVARGWGGLSESYRFLAEAYAGQGRLQEALETAREALGRGAETGQQEFVAGAWRALGLILGKLGNEEARASFSESLRLFSDMGMEGEQARTLREWARYELLMGDRLAGQRMWQEALALFTRLKMIAEQERMELEEEHHR